MTVATVFSETDVPAEVLVVHFVLSVYALSLYVTLDAVAVAF